MRWHSGSGFAVSFLFITCSAYAGSWEILPPLFPGYQTEGVAVSADGSVVVGSTGTPAGQRLPLDRINRNGDASPAPRRQHDLGDRPLR